MSKIKVLEKVVKSFSNSNIKFIVGGSLLLYFYQLDDRFNDIDLIIGPEDYLKAYDILKQMGIEQEISSSSMYCTEKIARFIVDNVGIDIMLNFCVSSKSERCIIEYEEPCDYIYTRNLKIPLGSLASWSKAYRLTPCGIDKAKKIDKYLDKSSQE